MNTVPINVSGPFLSKRPAFLYYKYGTKFDTRINPHILLTIITDNL